MGVVWQARKKKADHQIRKTKEEKQIGTKAPIALAKLGLTKLGIKGSGETATRVRRSRKVATGIGGLREVASGEERPGKPATAGAGGLTSLLLPVFLLLPAFLLFSASFAFRQDFFLVFDKRF